MILRKPYAFLIKYFKLIHILLVIPLCYLLYRTNVILNFFQEYINSESIITGRDFTGELFNTWMFALPFFMIAVLGILFGVMVYKKKPKIFYIFNILVIIAILVVYNFGYNMISTLETQVIATRTLRLMQDIFVILILFQGVSLILTFIRATGFDIKKFDFVSDLQKLDITEEDAEEFEVEVNVETNVLKRDIKKNIRFAKYIYVENKFIINGIFLIAFALICFLVYMNLTIYNKTYKQNQTFSASQFVMNVSNSYLTNKNYKGKEITDDYLLVIELELQALYENLTLNTAKFELKIKNNTYYPSDKFDSDLIDLGEVYNHKVIKNGEFKTKLLVYEIPKELINEKMTIKYMDTINEEHNKLNPKYIKIKLKPYDLDKEEALKKISLNENIKLHETILGETSINLTGFDIQNTFKIDYRYCNKNICYDSVEYLNPILNTNYDKVLLKIDGNLIDNDSDNLKTSNLYNVIKYFGKIKYRVGRKIKYYNSLTAITPKKIDIADSCYIEIPKEVTNSDEISLLIDVRDKVYEYIIK